MIIIVKQKAPENKLKELIHNLEEQSFKIHLSKGENTTIIGLVGDTSLVDIDSIKAKDIVDVYKRQSLYSRFSGV